MTPPMHKRRPGLAPTPAGKVALYVSSHRAREKLERIVGKDGRVEYFSFQRRHVTLIDIAHREAALKIRSVTETYWSTCLLKCWTKGEG